MLQILSLLIFHALAIKVARKICNNLIFILIYFPVFPHFTFYFISAFNLPQLFKNLLQWMRNSFSGYNFKSMIKL